MADTGTKPKLVDPSRPDPAPYPNAQLAKYLELRMGFAVFGGGEDALVNALKQLSNDDIQWLLDHGMYW